MTDERGVIADQVLRGTAKWVLELADRRLGQGMPPFAAAVVAIHDGSVVSAAVNEVSSAGDRTAHAEILALRGASVCRAGALLSDCVLVASSFPCVMCLGAALWTGIAHLYFVRGIEFADRMGFPDSATFSAVGIQSHSLESGWVSQVVT